jgi:alpha-2-macroglobulin
MRRSALEAVQSAVSLTDQKGERRIPVVTGRPTAEEISQIQPWGDNGSRLSLPEDHFVTVKPVTPLPTETTWRLRIDGTLASADGKRSLGQDRLDQLGSLYAYKVNAVEGVNEYDAPRGILISLNKPLHDDITDEVLAGFVGVNPKPADLTFEKSYSTIRIGGDFEFGKDYEIRVWPGLVAHDTTRLETEAKKVVKILPNPGFISLPAFSTAQNAAGAQRFEIQTGNLKGVRVRVKKLTDRDLIYAIRGYAELYGGYGDKQEIPFGMVPGRTIYDHEYPRTAAIDTSEKISLSWAEILEGEPHAAIYVCAEGTSETQEGFAVGAQSIIQLTDIGLAWKQDPTGSLVFAFSLKTGLPHANLGLELLDGEAEPLGELRTDAEGLVRIDRKRLEASKWLGTSLGKDRHIVETPGRYDAVGLWQFAIPYRYEELTDHERRTLLFTDRGVYKPGDTVHLKCLSRLTDGDKLLPVAQSGGQARLVVTDSRGRTVVDRPVELSERGSFDVSFEVPAEKTLGYYSVEVDFNDPEKEVDEPWALKFHHGFQVADYRPNTFEISIDDGAAKGETKEFQLPVSAKYYMGKPLSKAQLAWHVSAYPTWPQVRGFDDFRFGDSIEEGGSFSTSQKVHLSEIGEARIDFTLPESETGPAPMQVRVNAEITDINQQTVAQSTSFTVDSSDYYLGVRTPEGIVRAGEEAAFSLAAVSSDGEVLQAPVEALMKVERRIYNTVKVKGAGGRITTRTETELIGAVEQPVKFETRLHPETGVPVAASIPFTLAEAGDYEVTFLSKDADGRDVRTRTLLRVAGADEPAWTWHDGIRIDVTPDREAYQIGETAKLLVRSPVFGRALVTTERGGVRETRSLEITEHETVVEIPIVDGSAPNLFASVLIVRGSADSPHEHPNTDYRLGYCQLLVEDAKTVLEVAIEKPGAPWQLPGAEVPVGAVVTDHAGEPVENVEVTLYAVDEGVLSLTGYVTPVPGETFHAPFPLAVHTGQSLSDLLPENPGERSFDNKGYVIGGGGEEGLDPNRVRKNFQALAFWAGALVTDAEGRVSATFTAPDNLTTYRIVAVVAGENRFGSADDKLVINKPLIIEPALPAFGNAGDVMDLSAVLHNNTENSVDLEIRVQLDNHAEFMPVVEGLVPTSLKKTGEADRPDLRVRRVTLAAGETNKVGFPAMFTRMGAATWNWKATEVTNAALTDAVESKLQIGYPVPLLREARSLTLTEAGKSADLLAKVDPKLLNGRGKVSVTLSNSRALEALDAIDYLLEYPYGCVEQTTSSTLPWLSTQQLREALPQLKATDAEIERAIATGARRLISMQTAKGGLSYWPGGDEPMLWGSAYGGMALALAERSGTSIPADRLDDLWNYLSEQLRDTAKVTHSGDLHNRCLALYTLSLAGRSEPAYHDVLFNKRGQLSRDSRALLALAMMESAGGERDDALKQRVGTLLAKDKDQPGENPSHWYQPHYATAVELLAWSRWDALNARSGELLEGLLGVPKGRAAWGSTYLNSWGLMAIAENSAASASALADTVCRVKFGDEVREVVFGQKLSGELVTFDFEGDRRGQPLEVSLGNSAKIFAHVGIESQPEIAPRVAENHGFGIERTYHRLTAEGAVEPVESLEVGDMVLVTLHLSIPENEKFNNLAIDDPLPAVFEAVNPEFKTQAGDQQLAFHGDWKRLYCNHTELRTDRALFFCDYLHQGGDYAVQYLARVVAPGEATAAPAKIEAMYEPQRFGLSSTSRVTAKALDTAPKNRVAKN